MKAKKIEAEDIREMLVSSLPTHPTAPRSQGGMGYGASQMKGAFDRLPLHIVERYNNLLEDVGKIGEDSLAAAMPTGIKDSHTLADLFNDVESGAMATYLTFLGKSLSEHVKYIYSELEAIYKVLGKEANE